MLSLLDGMLSVVGAGSLSGAAWLGGGDAWGAVVVSLGGEVSLGTGWAVAAAAERMRAAATARAQTLAVERLALINLPKEVCTACERGSPRLCGVRLPAGRKRAKQLNGPTHSPSPKLFS